MLITMRSVMTRYFVRDTMSLRYFPLTEFSNIKDFTEELIITILLMPIATILHCYQHVIYFPTVIDMIYKKFEIFLYGSESYSHSLERYYHRDNSSQQQNTFLPDFISSQIEPPHLQETPQRSHRDSYQPQFLRSNNNQFLEIIIRFPIQAAWFIKTAMLCNTLFGIFLTFPIMSYLYIWWDVCVICSRPLRWWLLGFIFLQFIQSPIRYCYYRRIRWLTLHPQLFTVGLTSTPLSTHNDLANDSVSQSTIPLTSSSEESITFEEFLESTQPNRNETYYPFLTTNHLNSFESNVRQEGIQAARFSATYNCRQLSYNLRQMTSSYAWELCAWLSIATYIWFLMGIVWAITDDTLYACSSLSDTEGKHTERTTSWILTESLLIENDIMPEDVYHTVNTHFLPTVQTLTLIVIGLSLIRLIGIIILFYIALPSRCLSSSTSRFMRTRHDLSTLTLSSDSDSTSQYISSSLSSSHIDQDQLNSFFFEQEFRQLNHLTSDNSIDQSIYPLHFTENVIPSNELRQRRSSAIREFTFTEMSQLVNDMNFQTTQQHFSYDRRPPALTTHAINHLPIMYFSKFTFPNALKSPDSLQKSKLDACYQSPIGPETTQFYQHIQTNQDICQSSSFTSKHVSSVTHDNNKPYADHTHHHSDKSCHPCIPYDQSVKFIYPKSFHQKQTVISTQLAHEQYSDLFVGEPLFCSNCSICLEDFEDGAEISQLPCRHGFHRSCIILWLLQVDSCPLCQCRTASMLEYTSRSSM